jgi:isopenicillin-N N-acyltransferase like protein
MSSILETTASDSLREIATAGSAFERGCQYGSAVAADIRRFLQEGVARMEWILGRSVERSRLSEFIRAHAAVIEGYLPEIAEEVHGLAKGAGISIEDAYLLQCRREIMQEVASGDCTMIALGGPNSCIAQTIDLPGQLAEFALVLRSTLDRRTILQLTFIGLLGYVGMNDAGLLVGLNMVQGGEWRPGIPPYLLVRHLLELDTAEDCIEELRRLPRASSRCYTIVDENNAYQVETTPDQIVVREGSTLLHTNHYLCSEISDRSHVMYRRESRRRFEHLGRQFECQQKPNSVDDTLAADFFSILSCHGDAPICIHGRDDARRSETVAAVVMQNAPRRMLARRGNPCNSRTQAFGFGR